MYFRKYEKKPKMPRNCFFVYDVHRVYKTVYCLDNIFRTLTTTKTYFVTYRINVILVKPNTCLSTAHELNVMHRRRL